MSFSITLQKNSSPLNQIGKTITDIVTLSGTLKDPSRVRESWTQTFGGSANSNKVAVLEEGMKYTPISINPSEAQFLETRNFQITEIARIFRVPPHLIGQLEKATCRISFRL